MAASSVTGPEFELASSVRGTTRTVTPRGELDLASAGEVHAALDLALNEGCETVVLDLAETTFMDSTGVYLVLAVEAHARGRGARFVVLPGPPAVRRVLELSGLQSAESRGPSIRC